MSLVTPLKRTAIIVRDMERSIRFYRDVLGMNVWLQGPNCRSCTSCWARRPAPRAG